MAGYWTISPSQHLSARGVTYLAYAQEMATLTSTTLSHQQQILAPSTSALLPEHELHTHVSACVF